MEYEQTIKSWTPKMLNEEIGRLEATISDIVIRTEQIKTNPKAVLLGDKQEQLKTVLNKYGQVDCRNLRCEQIAMIFARLQGEETIIREDIQKLDGQDNEKASEKKLVIARRVLSEKKNNGGRRT